MKKALAVLVTVILALCLFVSCEEGSSSPAEYTLTFKTSDSQYEKTVTGGSYILPNATSVTRGLSPVFRGWQIEGETEIREAGDIITVSRDMTLTAIYSSPVEYTLTFKTSDNEYEKTVTAGSYTLPSATSVTGGLNPVFRGWQIEGDTKIMEAGDIITVSSDMTLTARYKDDCKVTVKDEESVVAEDHLIYGERYTLPSALEKKGYNFLGWKVGEGEEPLAAGEKIIVTADTTVTASWTKAYTCLVDYNYKECREVYVVNKGTQVKISDWDITTLAEEYGRTFLGWYLNGDKYLKSETSKWSETVTIEKNSVMTAIWAKSGSTTDPDTYHTVTFKNYYGTNSDLKVMIMNGNTVYLPDEMNPEESGKTFRGWYKGEGDNKTKFDFSTKITADTATTLTLEAEFDDNLTVTFYSDNGTPWGVTSQSVTKTYGSTIEEKELAKSKPNMDDCEFAGWYNGDKPFVFGDDGTKVTSNVTYTAKWKCTVTFNINNSGSSDTYAPQKIFVGSTVTAPAANPTTTERHTKFVYWSLTPNGAKYDFSTPVTGPITLYAVWRLSGNGKIVI